MDRKLHVNYKPVFENTIYDVCNLEGRILFTGKVPIENDLIIDMSSCRDGHYNLFILDGANLIKRTFRLDSELSFQ